MNAWKVYLADHHIDTVFYDETMDGDEVRDSLVSHDGYDPEITVELDEDSPIEEAEVKLLRERTDRIIDSGHHG